MSSYWNTNDLPNPPAHVVAYDKLRDCLKQSKEQEAAAQCRKHYFRIYRESLAQTTAPSMIATSPARKINIKE
jgi:hypothetical protein